MRYYMYREIGISRIKYGSTRSSHGRHFLNIGIGGNVSEEISQLLGVISICTLIKIPADIS